MTRKNHLGTASLLIASGGFAFLETLHHVGLTSAHVWTILQSGCEAGMVGGVADWFAVSALFRPIPSKRFCLPHTNLIVEKRETLSKGIVDMVQNRWLSPETLAEHLGRLSASRFILEHLATPQARGQIVEAARVLQARGRTDIRIVMIGDGNERTLLEARAREAGLANLEFRGLVPKTDLPGWLHRADCALLTIRDVPVMSTCSSRK